jgi:hypothetical protein
MDKARREGALGEPGREEKAGREAGWASTREGLRGGMYVVSCCCCMRVVKRAGRSTPPARPFLTPRRFADPASPPAFLLLSVPTCLALPSHALQMRA